MLKKIEYWPETLKETQNSGLGVMSGGRLHL